MRTYFGTLFSNTLEGCPFLISALITAFEILIGLLITGANGYIGKLLLEKCANSKDGNFNKIVALDIKLPEKKEQLESVFYEELDIRSKKVKEIIKKQLEKIN